MKKILIAALLSVFAVSAYAQRPNLQGVVRLERYSKQNQSVPAGTVVFAGNSITDGWPSASPDFFKDNNFVGRGIGGQTSLGLLLRFRQDVIDLKPEAVVINIGTNDIAENNGPYNHQLTLSSIKSMAELADYNGIKVILSSVLPVKEYGWNKAVTNVPEKIRALNADMKAFAEEKGFAYIDYYTPMSEPDGALKAAYTRDGVHPVKAGYTVMEQEALKVVSAVLKDKKVNGKKKSKAKRGLTVGASVGMSVR